MERYRVYVGTYQNLSQKIKYSFYDPMMSRMLVFASRKPAGDFRVMKISEQEALSARESRWLHNARICVALNNTSQSASEFAQSMNRFLDILEQELKREKEALSNGIEGETDKQSAETG